MSWRATMLRALDPVGAVHRERIQQLEAEKQEAICLMLDAASDAAQARLALRECEADLAAYERMRHTVGPLRGAVRELCEAWNEGHDLGPGRRRLELMRDALQMVRTYALLLPGIPEPFTADPPELER